VVKTVDCDRRTLEVTHELLVAPGKERTYVVIKVDTP